jgi:hypothetical protein
LITGYSFNLGYSKDLRGAQSHRDRVREFASEIMQFPDKLEKRSTAAKTTNRMTQVTVFPA